MVDYETFDATIDMLRKYQEAYPAFIMKSDGSLEAVSHGRLWAQPRDSAAVDRALTLSAAHRLLSVLADDTLSREVQAECRDVMAKLEKMVEGA